MTPVIASLAAGPEMHQRQVCELTQHGTAAGKGSPQWISQTFAPGENRTSESGPTADLPSLAAEADAVRQLRWRPNPFKRSGSGAGARHAATLLGAKRSRRES